MEETKRDKFVRLAESRMNNTLKQIQILGNLANTSNYDYTEEDVDKMIRTLRKAVNELEASFKGESKSKKFNL